MKSLIISLLFLVFGPAAFAQAPDPMDSIILESKTVAPGAHPGASDTAAYLYIRVWITNKDSLTFLKLALVQKSISGGAWMELGRPRNNAGVYNRLTSTLGTNYECFGGPCYDSDSFLISGGYTSLATIEPPNLIRKPFWELKFDSVLNGPGITELDTGTLVTPFFMATHFINTALQILRVNFVKSVITVVPKGDLNLDGLLTEPGLSSTSPCDMNCDSRRSPADVILLLNALFNGSPFPC